MDNNEIIDYVMHTPNNSNPNVMRGILEKSSGGNSGWKEVNFSDIDFTFNPRTDWILNKRVWLNTSSRMIIIFMSFFGNPYDRATMSMDIGAFSEGSKYLPLQAKNPGEALFDMFLYSDYTTNEDKCGQIIVDNDSGLSIATGQTSVEGHKISIDFTFMYAY